ncbi:MAG: xylulokinase [Clostridia bacterium]|nr:xylulokinase [Clostridia bacterium]
MKSYIGIDLGTSGVKLILVDENGKILNSVTKSYPISYPHDGWSEQNPEDWYKATLEGLSELTKDTSKLEIEALSFGGQMHGLVLLDKNDNVIRPAILWNDGRTGAETDYLNNIIGKDALSSNTANIAFAGFTLPKILWVKNNEIDNFNKIEKIMLPKDYLAYMLSGVFATDLSDASGMLLLDVKNRKWSEEMIKIAGITRDMLPSLYESYEKIGTLKPEIASKLGFGQLSIIIGAGDNAAASVGTGAVNHGDCNISLGTSGTVFVSQDSFFVDESNALHSFCHSNGKYHLMGCILSAASCNKWWVEDILGTSDFRYEEDECEQYMGENNVMFLPYLMGERSPHNDVNARGAFIGMRPDTTRKQMTLAVLEGVSFALRDCVEIAKSGGVVIEKTKLCGGGAKSALWRKIMANVLGIPVIRPETEEGPAYGGAILAMVGTGRFESVNKACGSLIKDRDVTYPDKDLTHKYEKKYQLWKKLYPALKDIYKQF